ncbi:MAG: hypothetical protein LH679_17275, partial [Cyanobacteria bacterium CAN_BIN43]|nr:hypothetical protein [Cyanobacteria bacterium CAN_BIN43]
MPVNPLFSAIQANTFFNSDQLTSAAALVSNQARPMRAVAMAADGSFAITWSSKGQDGGGAEWGAYVRFFGSDGTPTSAETRVNLATPQNQSTTSIALLQNGNYIVTWSDDNEAAPDTSLSGVQARIYKADGTAVSGELQINQATDGDQYNSAIATSANGRFVVTWVSNNDSIDTTGDAVLARVFNSDGTPFGSEFLVNSTTASNQLKPSVAMADDGSFVVVWESQGQDGEGAGVYGQRYTAAGAPQGLEFQINQITAKDQKTASVAMAANGSFVVTWTSNEGGAYGNEIYARRY